MFPERLALVAQGFELTYRQLDMLSSNIAGALIDAGVACGDRVAYLLGNNAVSVVVYQAIQKIGAVAVPLNKRLLSTDIAYMITLVDARILFFDSDIEALVSDAVGKSSFSGLLVMCGGVAKHPVCSWDDFKERGAGLPTGLEPCCTAADSESLILFTSGTTGRPKAVVRTAKAVYMLSLIQLIEQGTSEAAYDILYTQAPLFHLGGFLAMLKVIASSGTLVVESHFDEARVFDLVERYSVNQLYMIPPVLFRRLLTFAETENRLFPSVLEAQCAGGKVSDDVAKAVFALFPNARLRVSFGSSETGALCTAYISREHYEKQPEHAVSAGKVNVLVEIKLVDSEGNQVGTGVSGEALVRSPMMFAGYLGDNGKYVKPFDEGGYYRTGDIFRLDDEGYYTFSGRTREIIKSGGENVFAAEVEQVITKFPGIAECAVIGVPDELYGEGIAAAIVMSPEGASIDRDGLIAFCKEHMPSFQKPRYLAVLPNLPRNSIGKIQKSVLEKSTDLFEPLFDADGR